MKEQFIPYEQALQLKELGFNDICLTFYNYTQKLDISDDWAWGVDMEDKKDRNHCLAPLWQQVFDWFRNKYDLHFYIHHFIEQPMGDEIWKHTYQIYINDNPIVRYFKTYEEARLECLKELIKIVQNDKDIHN